MWAVQLFLLDGCPSACVGCGLQDVIGDYVARTGVPAGWVGDGLNVSVLACRVYDWRPCVSQRKKVQ